MDNTVEKDTPDELLRSVLAQCSKWVEGEQQFKYNGKEYDPMHGLNEYDYGAPSDEPLFFTSCKIVICDFCDL